MSYSLVLKCVEFRYVPIKKEPIPNAEGMGVKRHLDESEGRQHPLSVQNKWRKSEGTAFVSIKIHLLDIMIHDSSLQCNRSITLLIF